MSGVDAVGRLLPSLLVLLVALVGVRWWLRRQGTVGQQMVRVIARTGLARGAVLTVVQAGDRHLLLGVTDHQITLLTELSHEAALSAEGPYDQGASFVPEAMDASGSASPREAVSGPRMGFVDRLRDMTVRSTPPRPPRARP